MNATRRGRREGAAALARWKDDGFTSVDACLHNREQVYAEEMRTVERHKALPKRRWQRVLLREQERYLGSLLAGARMMADELRPSNTSKNGSKRRTITRSVLS